MFKKALFFLVVIVISFFVLIGLSKDFVSFVKSKTVKIVAVNANIISVDEKTEGTTLFLSLPIFSNADGIIHFLIADGVFVNKGSIVAQIVDKDSETDILSPEKGIFLRCSLNYYTVLLNDFINDKVTTFSINNVNEGKKIHSGDIIASVVKSNDYLIKIGSLNVSDLPNTVGIKVEGSLEPIKASVVKSKEGNIYLQLNDFFQELYDKKTFTVFFSDIRGFEVEKRDVVKREGSSGVYIVNGDRVRFVLVDLYDADDKLLASIKDPYFKEFSTFFLIKAPSFVKEGDPVGSF